MPSPDIVFFVTPAAATKEGDYLGIEQFAARFPKLRVEVVGFSDPTTEVSISRRRVRLRQDGRASFELSAAKAFVYFPLSFEPEDVSLRPPERHRDSGEYEHRQWRAVTAWLETQLPRWGRCLNDPTQARAASNKLIQMSAVRAPLALPPTWIGNDTAAHEFLSDRRAVVKSLSEGTFTGATVAEGHKVFTRPALSTDQSKRAAPMILQQLLESPVELRSYVVGERVLTLEISRARVSDEIPDVRAAGLDSDDVKLSDDWHTYDGALIDCTRRLGLQYAVFDLLPVGEILYLLEVNSNGVWTSRTEAAKPIGDIVHNFIANLLY